MADDTPVPMEDVATSSAEKAGDPADAQGKEASKECVPPAVEAGEVDGKTKAVEEQTAEDKGSVPTTAVEEQTAKDKGSVPTTAVADASERRIVLAGRTFTKMADLAAHVKKIQESVSDDEGRLSTESCLFLFHLFLNHPMALEKLNTSPISHFRFGTYEQFKNKCFIIVRTDGSQEGVSAMKSIKEIFAASGTSSSSQQEPRGVKRDREAPEVEPAAARTFEPVQWVRGCVLDIHGCPSGVDYEEIRETMSGFGHVKFLKLLHDAKRTRRGNLKSEDDAPIQGGGSEQADVGETPTDGKVETDSKKAEATSPENHGKTDVAETQAGDVGAATESEPQNPKPSKDNASEAKDDADSQRTTEAPVKENVQTEEADDATHGEDGGGDEVDSKITVRCRFSEPQGAQKALEGLKEVDGVKVRLCLLEGAEEDAFWVETNAKMKDRFERHGEQKGKSKGKGKDKGKGKGKEKGKGKGKGKKKGKHDRD